MPRKRQKRLYTKRGRYYVDVRDFGDVGGGKEALIPSGERFATTDRRQARRIAKARLREFKALRRSGAPSTAVDLTQGDVLKALPD